MGSASGTTFTLLPVGPITGSSAAVLGDDEVFDHLQAVDLVRGAKPASAPCVRTASSSAVLREFTIHVRSICIAETSGSRSRRAASAAVKMMTA